MSYLNELKFNIKTSCVNTGNSDWKQNSDQWILELNGVTFDYWTGVGLRDNGELTTPKLEDILHSLFSDFDLVSTSINNYKNSKNCENMIIEFLDFHSDFGLEDIHDSWAIFCDIVENSINLQKSLGDLFDVIHDEIINSAEESM